MLLYNFTEHKQAENQSSFTYRRLMQQLQSDLYLACV